MPVTPAPGEDELRERLAARTLELVDIPSESRDEAALAAHVAGVLRGGGADVEELGDCCVLARPSGMQTSTLAHCEQARIFRRRLVVRRCVYGRVTWRLNVR